MTTPQPVELMGAPGSPYTRKMLALMRFRHIPYRVRWQDANHDRRVRDQYPQPKVRLLPTYYFPDENGALQAVTDSSPILRRFEAEYQGRSVIPSDPVLAFLNWLVEDYGDEWLTKAMFHYRWHYADDIKKAGSILPRWHNLTGTEEEIAPMSKLIRERQMGRLSYVGSNDTTKPTIEDSFVRLLDILDAHLQCGGFVFGARPASADFALYGQLTQLALFDPTPQKIVIERVPRVYAWIDIMEDLSGRAVSDEPASEYGWIDASTALPDTLLALLAEIGRLYLPYLRANAEAVMQGAEQVSTELDGRAWTQNPFPYQAKCLQWIVEQYNALSADDKTRLTKLTQGTNIVEGLGLGV